MSRNLFHRLARSASRVFGERRPSPRRPRSRPPQIEALETRQLLACNPGILNQVLRANCDNTSNSVTLVQLDAAFTRIIYPGGQRDFNHVAFSSILLNMGTAADSITILSVPPGKPVTVEGESGLDVVTLGSPPLGLRGILSPVLVQNFYSYTSLRLLDRGNPTARAVTMGINSFTNVGDVAGLAPALIQYRVADLRDLFVQTGDGFDSVSIASTRSNGGFLVPVTLDNAGGSDVVNVGNAAAGLQDIQAPLIVGPATGQFRLNLNDAANTTGRNVTTTWNPQSGHGALIGLAPATIYYHPISFNGANNRIHVRNGSGNDQYQINAIGGNTYESYLQLDLGAGNDRVTVGLEKPSGYYDVLQIAGQAGADSLVFNYQNMPLGRSYNLITSAINHPNILTSFETLEDLTLNAGPGGDTIAVTATAAAVTTTVNGGAGNDSLIVGGAFSGMNHLGPLTVRGQDGTDILSVDDQYATGGQVYTVTAAAVAATTNGVTPISYETAEGVVLHAGTGSDFIQVLSTAAGAPVTVNGGNGDDTISVGGADFIWTQAAPVTVNGQGGIDYLYFSDQGTAAPQTYTVTATMVRRSGNNFGAGYATTEYLALYAGYGDDTVLVQSTAAAVLATIVSAGYGDDTIRLTSGALAGQYLLAYGDDGRNTLDYSLYTSAVYAYLPYGVATDIIALGGIQNVVGGAGNDTFLGDDQDNLLSGGAGDDVILAAGGNDVLLGGLGVDALYGGDGEDVLIGGVTDHDAAAASLRAIAQEWSRLDLGYAERVERLSTGADGLPALNTQTVHDDLASNVLAGEGGLDWFFAGYGDVIQDLEEGERVDYVV